MEARLFAHSEIGGFDGREDLREWLSGDLRKRGGLYFLRKKYRLAPDSLAFFDAEGRIVGCAIVAEPPHDIEEPDEKSLWGKIGHRKDFRAVMRVDPASIHVWESHQDVAPSEIGVRILPGPPITLDARQVLGIFTLVAARK
jgi:hypothetical protein